MDRMGTLEGGGRGFRETEKADLAGTPKLRHGADRVLDGRVGVDPVLIVEVDGLDLEALQARLAAAADVVGPAVDPEEAPVGTAHVAELGRQHDLVAPAREGPAHELLVPADAVHVGGIEEGDAEFDGAMDGRDRFPIVAPAVELRHPHERSILRWTANKADYASLIRPTGSASARRHPTRPPAPPPASPHRARQVVGRSTMVEFIAQVFGDDGADEEEGFGHDRASPNLKGG